MGKWQRSLYQPVLPLGKDGKRVTGSAEHIALSRKAAGEGMVLVKNENETLPLAKGTKVALFGKGTIDYVKGGGGSGDVTVAYIRNFYEGMKIKEAEGVQVKVGPQILTLIADKRVFDAMPLKKTVKVEIAGLYIVNIVGMKSAEEMKAIAKAKKEKAKEDKKKK